jgi:transposase-like protein
MAIAVLDERGQSHSAVARLMGVTEGAVRYRLARQVSGAVDGRKKASRIEELGLAEAVRQWWAGQEAMLGPGRPPSVRGLLSYLQEEHEYGESYKTVLRHVRSRFPAPKVRPFRRVETPAGAQSQTDWMEMVVDIGDADGPAYLYGLLMKLSHSRRKALVWSRSKEQLAWLHCHSQGFLRLGGVAAVNRVDNEKTAIGRGAGPWGEINDVYRAYSRSLGFHVDACEPRSPEQKGKVERDVRTVRGWLSGKRFGSLAELQAYTDKRLETEGKRAICPATGKTIEASWEAEKALLRPLPAVLPEPFDLVRDCPVHDDCTVRFEGRAYTVPFAYVRLQVEVRGCSGFVQVVDPKTGAILATYPRGTAERIRIDQSCYEGESTDRVKAPKPLGLMARKLMELAESQVQLRSADYYAELAEVAR